MSAPPRYSAGGVPCAVHDAGRAIEGVLSALMSAHISARPITTVMTRNPVTVRAEASLSEALAVMGERGISSVLVFSEPTAPDGIVTMRDVVGKVVRHDLDPETLRARDVATWRLVTAGPSWTVREAAETMARARIRRLPVVHQDDLVGIVSDTDVFVALAAGRDAAAIRVTEIMSSPVRTVEVGVRLEACSARMADEGIRRFPVTLADQIVGIISDSDILQALEERGGPD